MMQYRKLIGRTVLYFGKEITIKDIKPIGDDLFQVVTTNRAFNLRSSEIRKEFLPIETEIERADSLTLYRGIQLESKEMGSLADTLLDTIERVRTDKTYIDQAQSINETAKTLIDLKRAQIELIRLIKS